MKSQSSSSRLSPPPPPPFTARRRPPTFARGCATVMCGLFLASGCGASEPGADSEFDTSSATSESALERRHPSPGPEYTADQLATLAATPEIRTLNMPFAVAPTPDQSMHVTMSDGTRLAVSLYFPPGFDRGAARAPVVYVETWYGRMVEATATAIDLYRQAGFVVAIVDPRGFGASFGYQEGFLTSEVRHDEREMIGWLATQPWSSGKVATAGMSISASQAEAIASSGVPNLQAAIVRASDFDHYANNMFPGGIPNLAMHGLVADVTTWMRGEPCVQDLAACASLGIASVDGDNDLRLLQAAFGEHQRNLRGEVLGSLVYRDDALGTGTVDDLSTVGSLDGLRRAAVPARISASWLDGTTADSALTRFKALPDVAMELSIGATAHSGGVDADPFSRQPFQSARPAAGEQYASDVAFVRKVFAGESVGRNINYYVLGAGVWKTTPSWPPRGTSTRALQLSRTELVDAPSGRTTASRVRPGERHYQVDPTASSGGPFHRWGSQRGEVVYYGDRRAAAGRRLSFDGAPFDHDMELVGAPELCLAMRTDKTDGAVFAYLEDVAPDGRVTYLTEGELRLLHRKSGATNQASACDPQPGTRRSFNRVDGAAVTPGELMHVELPLLSTAALVRKGHRLRLSLAGADAGTFPLLTDTPANWVVSFGGDDGSTLNLPVRPWSAR